MPTWSEYQQIAKQRGALALELFLVESRLVVPPEEMQKHLPDHLAYQKQLEEAGTLFMAGPLSDATGTQMSGGGMIIYRASSIKEATQIAAADPMHKENAREFTVRSWLVNEGSLSVNVQLAGQAVDIS